jgi:type IV pilus assembly protein PilY1
MKTSQRCTTAAKPVTAVLCALLCLAGLVPGAAAQTTDISTSPLVTAAPNAVKPNIMFILDDSGSMGRDYMPDDAGFAEGKYGRNAAQCNGLAYNPTIIYDVPVDASGNNLAAGAYVVKVPGDLPNIRTVSTAVSVATSTVTLTLQLSTFNNNSYSTNDLVTLFSNTTPSNYMVGVITSVDAGNNRLTIRFTDFGGSGSITNARIGDGDFRPFYFTYNTYTGSPAALSYSYSSGSLNTSSTFYRECDSVIGDTSATGSGRFTKVVLNASTITQNYRNWYTYYRTRMLMMTTATSRAFRGIDDKYRVGYSTISSKSVDGSLFLDVADFDATQKATWYSRLNGSPPAGYTPLRAALSKAGRYYAKKATLNNGNAQTVDPMQFSCQKNFAILTTDGYWNTGCNSSGTNCTETGNYRPLRLDGSTLVGQQDDAVARPMRDGATVTIEERTSLLQQRSVTNQAQSATMTLQSRTGQLQTRTRANNNAAWTSWSNVASCTWDTSGGSRQDCRYNWSAWSSAATCTAVAANTNTSNGTTWTGNARDCQYVSSGWSNVGSCTPSSPGPSSGPNYTVASATVCQTLTSTSPWVNVASCTAAGSTQCQYTNWTSYSTVGSCTAAPRSAGPGYTVSTARDCRSTSTGGSSDSLADVAMYYYQTDLRDASLSNCALANGTDVCANNVTPSGNDAARHQHMSTFTLGLGVNGTLGYNPNYLGGDSPDYQALIAGTKNWPNPGDDAGAVNIDDLWHAAVNGRGQYFSATNPTSLAQSLSSTLAAIDSQTGTASAAATSTLQPVAGDNTEYVTSYTTVFWFGDLVSYQVDPQTGARSSTPNWSAQQLLDARVAGGTARNIYYMQRNAGANTGTLQSFTYANLSAGLRANFDGACSKSPALTQCATTGFDVSGANSGTNLVSWLRGQPDAARYRTRQHLLGDTVGGAPVYVRRPPFSYTENNYQTWAASINASNSGAGRKGVVYVPANDGMLHAIDGTTGQELWAYVPSMVMDRMYKLADSNYATRHEFFVNATPVIGDIWVPGSPGTWKTILVGGLGAGGRGYYALDITNPDAPVALWEFTNDSLGGNNNLGLTFGNPVITKRANGQWVVAFASGYNNVSPGDGNGRLFVVNANTGQRLTEVQTYTATGVPAGSTGTPNGLAKINNWVDSPRDNTTARYYGGDLLGNLWRFDIDGVVAPNNAALRLAQLRAGSPAVAQPITTRPELAMVTQGGVNYPVVYVASGKLLGLSDLSSTAQQTVYAIKDPLTNTQLGDVHASSNMVAQTLTEDTVTRTRSVTSNPVDWSSNIGWRVDLLSAGERVNIDMRLALTTLVVGANAPSNDACTSGGTAYLYQFDFGSGGALPGTNGVAGEWLGNSFAVGIGLMQLYSPTSGVGQGGTIVRVQRGDGGVSTSGVYQPNSAAVQGRRTSWRELVN